MSDFPVSPLSATAVQQQTQPLPPDSVQPVGVGPETRQGTVGSGQETTSHMPTELEKHMARQTADRRLTGPPPAFEATLLELEADIDFAIKRLEAAREKSRDERALAAPQEGADHQRAQPAEPVNDPIKPPIQQP